MSVHSDVYNIHATKYHVFRKLFKFQIDRKFVRKTRFRVVVHVFQRPQTSFPKHFGIFYTTRAHDKHVEVSMTNVEIFSSATVFWKTEASPVLKRS